MRDYIKFIEELSFNAWPAYKTELYDDWLIRYSNFYTHRTNCVNIIGSSLLAIDEKIKYCEEEYLRLQTPCIFKINPVYHGEIDTLLRNRNYKEEHRTDTYVLDLDGFTPVQNPSYSVILNDSITSEWIHNLLTLNHTTDPVHFSMVPKMYEAIPRNVVSAYITDNGRIIATGLGIIERDHMGIYAIYVDQHYRNQQLAKTICSSLLLEAKNKNLHHAYLQVVADNYVAKKVYESLGFSYLYTYWFLVN